MSARSYLVEAFHSLGRDINKAGGSVDDETREGIVGELLPELSLDMDDDELVKLSDSWENDWKNSEAMAKWSKLGEENEKYWEGEQYNKPDVDKTRPLMDNVIFEGLETYLPQVTRRNPEPVVALASAEEHNEENEAFVKALQGELADLADDLKMRLKLKGSARNWSVRLLGVIKFGWDLDNDRPSMKVVRPTKMILDPNAVTDEDGYTGDRIGEYRRLPAWRIIRATSKEPGAAEIKQFIEEKTKGENETKLQFIEWWTQDYVFWKIDSKVLMKRKNPHWNYDQQVAQQEEQETDQGQEGIRLNAEQFPSAEEGGPAIPALPQSEGQATPEQPTPTSIEGVNHFPTRRMPYIFLSVFNLGKQPMDVTSNITQNLSSQDLINKRLRQIDKNADNANNGLVVSLARAGMTKEQASRVATALRKGGVVGIPDGAPQEAVWKPPVGEIPVYVYNQMVDTRNRVRDVWGTRGSSPAGIENEDTVRGKIISRGLDTDRIGGGISEFLEQHADDAYNWLVQLLYVYDDRFVENFSQGIKPPKVKISVKEGSLLPKDSTTIANQAIELAGAGKMSLLDLYERLDYPNAKELATNVWLEQNAPEVLYGDDPRVAQVIKQRQEAAAQAAQGERKEPSKSINFKDLPPEGKTQLAGQAGIELNPVAVAAQDAEEKIQGEQGGGRPAIPLPDSIGGQ